MRLSPEVIMKTTQKGPDTRLQKWWTSTRSSGKVSPDSSTPPSHGDSTLNPERNWHVHRQSGGSFGDAFGRQHVLHGEVSPKKNVAVEAQLEAEDRKKALLEQKQVRKGE